MSAPRHVLMTTDTVGGVWSYSIELARALGTAGVAVSLAAMGAPVSASQRLEARTISGLTLLESTYRLEWMEDPWEDVAAAGDWLVSLERQLRPDIVHLNGYVHGSLPWSAPCVVVAHSCVFSWWNAVRGADPPVSWNRYRELVRAGLRDADATVAVSQVMADAISIHYSADGAIVIPNGRRHSDYVCGTKEEIVLTCGRAWDEAKNIRTLDAVAGELPWAVCVAGEVRHPEGGTAALTSSRPLGQLTHADLRDWFARAAIFALPARYEPFGLAVLEAGLSGCALVLGDIPSLRELWQGAAIFVTPSDTEKLRNELISLIHSSDKRQELAARALDRAAQFTPGRMLDSYLRVYQKARMVRARKQEAAASCAS